MSSKFAIDGDLLGLVAFLILNGGGDPWLLTEIHDQLDPKHVENHIVTLAWDCLRPSLREALRDWVVKGVPMSETNVRALRDLGWLYGAEPNLAKRMTEIIKLYDAPWGMHA